MATFWIEGGQVMNQDKFLEELRKDTEIGDSRNMGKPKKVSSKLEDIDKLHIPHGDKNYKRINNVNDSDMLIHIQQYLAPSNRCILDMITSGEHTCQKTNDNIRRVLHQYALSQIDDDLKDDYPRYFDENEDDYIDRLCHIIMHTKHPQKLRMLYCSECIRNWLNSQEW